MAITDFVTQAAVKFIRAQFEAQEERPAETKTQGGLSNSFALVQKGVEPFDPFRNPFSRQPAALASFSLNPSGNEGGDKDDSKLLGLFALGAVGGVLFTLGARIAFHHLRESRRQAFENRKAALVRELTPLAEEVRAGSGPKSGSFTVKNEEETAAIEAQMSQNLYGPELVKGAQEWMAIMELAMKRGYPLSRELVEAAEVAGNFGHSGGSYWLASQYVQKVWVHGDDFKRAQSPGPFAPFIVIGSNGSRIADVVDSVFDLFSETEPEAKEVSDNRMGEGRPENIGPKIIEDVQYARDMQRIASGKPKAQMNFQRYMEGTSWKYLLDGIGLDPKDLATATSEDQVYKMIVLQLRAGAQDQTLGEHQILWDTLQSVDNLIRDHRDIFSNPEKIAAFRFGIIRSYAINLSGEGQVAKVMKMDVSVEGSLKDHLSRELDQSAKRDLLIEEARKMDEVFRKGAEERDREKVEGRK